MQPLTQVPSLISFVTSCSFTNLCFLNGYVTCFFRPSLGRLVLSSNTCLFVVYSQCYDTVRTAAHRYNVTTVHNSIIRKQRSGFITGLQYPKQFVLPVKNSFQAVDVEDVGYRASFYEQCIIEVNKIAVQGRRVFNNATSSKTDKYAVISGTTFIDDVADTTRYSFFRRMLKRRTHSVLRNRRIVHSLSRGKYFFRRLNDLRGLSDFRLPNGKLLTRRTVSKKAPAHTRRVLNVLLPFFHFILLREKISLRKRAEYTLDI
jgi:hypothetical protein